MIEISNLTKTYRGNVRALRGIDLDVGSGMFGLVGPNGAGKTTLMRILAGLLRPTTGTVRILGHDLTLPAGKLAVKATLGYLPQELGFYPDLSAREFLDYVAVLKGLDDRATRNRQIEELLARVGLTEVAGRRLKTYSGGMKRRVGVAQALLGSPQLLIVDEPTAGLDPEERVRLRNLLAEMATHCTVILSTHIVEDISQSCNDLAVLNEGRVLFRGSPRDLIAQAQGRVWTITVPRDGAQVGPSLLPTSSLVTVSTLQMHDSVQYRVLGDLPTGRHATPAEPSLEDGYLWLMRRGSA